MGQIRNLQTDYLRQGSEPITYERYDSEGVFIETINEDVLYQVPSQLTPLNRDLVKAYEKPLKEVKFSTELSFVYFRNENAHFLYDDNNWIIGDPETYGTNGVITHTGENAKAVSGNKYFKTTVPWDETYQLDDTRLIRNDHQYTTAKVNVPYEIQFSHYIDGTEGNNYSIDVRFFVQETYNSNIIAFWDEDTATGTKYYHFERDEWVTSAADIGGSSRRFESSTTNNWETHRISIKPYTPSSSSVSSVYIGVVFFYPVPSGHSEVGGYNAYYLDNIGMGQSIDVKFNKITAVRKQYDYVGTYTGKYESQDNALSNEAKTTEYFMGKVDGSYKRTRDTAAKTLEAIITQEILNDSRDFMTMYEGTFRAKRNGHLSLHHKLWIDFGADILQEPVSCYLDAMKYDVKASEYQIRMHVPNQDDDVGSTYNVYVE
jgi:hypothetical protein